MIVEICIRYVQLAARVHGLTMKVNIELKTPRTQISSQLWLYFVLSVQILTVCCINRCLMC